MAVHSEQQGMPGGHSPRVQDRIFNRNHHESAQQFLPPDPLRGILGVVVDLAMRVRGRPWCRRGAGYEAHRGLRGQAMLRPACVLVYAGAAVCGMR